MQELYYRRIRWTYPNDANGTIFNLHYNTWTPRWYSTALFAGPDVAAVSNKFIRVTTARLRRESEFKKFNAEPGS